MLRLTRNSSKTIESAAPVTQSKLAANSKSSKLLDLPRNPICFRLAKASRLHDRANENGAGATTITRLPSRTPHSDHPWIANPIGTAMRTRSLPKHCACAAKRYVQLEKLRFPHRGSKNDTRQVIQATCKTLSPTTRLYVPLVDACDRLRTLSGPCGRLRTQRRVWRTHADPLL